MLAIVAPGQGSQIPGMLSAWLEDSALKDFVAQTSDAIGLDLLRLGTTADADEIKDTANAQPLIVMAGLVGARALGIQAAITAGHSVGEITSAAIAGVLSEHDALSLVRTRGIEMAKAAALKPAGMSAVLGGDRDGVLAAIASAGLVAANDNGGGQIVAAGDLSALESFGANPPASARVRALAVAGAFHTPFMSPAVDPLRALAAGLQVSDPKISILSNKDGAKVTTGREVLDRIVNQIANPVRWDLCMQTLADLGVTGVLEIPPAGTLVGLVKRAQPQIAQFALKSPADLDAAREFCAGHA